MSKISKVSNSVTEPDLTTQTSSPTQKVNKAITKVSDNSLNRFKKIGKIKKSKGNVLNPENSGLRMILTPVTLTGEAIHPLYSLFDKKWTKVKEIAKNWYINRTGAYKMGAINTLAVQSDIWIMYMLCQEVLPDKSLKTNNEALEECLKKISASALYEKATVHVSSTLLDTIPEIMPLLNKCVISEGVNVYIYNE